MTRIETEIYKQDANDLVGVKVITYDDNDTEIDNVIVVDEEDFNSLQANLINHDHGNTYVTINMVNQEIRSQVETLLGKIIQNYNFPKFKLQENGDLYAEYR